MGIVKLRGATLAVHAPFGYGSARAEGTRTLRIGDYRLRDARAARRPIQSPIARSRSTQAAPESKYLSRSFSLRADGSCVYRAESATVRICFIRRSYVIFVHDSSPCF